MASFSLIAFGATLFLNSLFSPIKKDATSLQQLISLTFFLLVIQIVFKINDNVHILHFA